VTDQGARPHVVWIYAGDLSRALDAATWLETTRELRHAGWKVTLICAGKRGKTTIRGVDVQCLSRPNVYLLRQIALHVKIMIWLWMEWLHTDVILFHESSVPWMIALRGIRCIGCRWRPLLVLDSRSLSMPPRMGESLREKAKRVELAAMNTVANRWVDGRVAITNRLAEVLRIPEDKLWGTWPSGAAVGPLAVVRTERRWPTVKGPVRLIYHGALHRERNLTTLCNAVIQANEHGMHMLLKLVGEGTERARLAEMAASSRGAITVGPPVPYEEIPVLLAGSDVGVLPFPDEEKFRVSSPIKLYEYMAAGMPVVATRIVCHTDVVGDGGYVFWAEGADQENLLAALGQVWESRQDLPQKGREAAVASRAWSWRASAEKLAEALASGMKEARRETWKNRSEAVRAR
jgi:glycosyltransferase involved in cell wall biosynthesis